jgi:dinuclear metal center YbgI/SA1388 family protein
MKVKELITHIESWAPPGIAWEGDNIGLQVGSSEDKISNILLTLELDDKSLNQAIQKKCNFIFTHHPLIFKPLKKIDTAKDNKSKLIEKLIKNNITLFSAHTNLDFTRGGVSFELANVLKLKNIDFLEISEENQVKIVVFVPSVAKEKVAGAIFEAGGGIIGQYDKCSYRIEGKGSFRGSEDTNPVIGEKQNYEFVDETRLEIIAEKWKLGKIISALINAHPYEEPAYDIYPLKNKNKSFGYGAIGELDNSLTEKEFLAHVTHCLKTKNLRYCRGSKKRIKKIAVCGGSGTELLQASIRKGADAFVTADIKYHTFQDAENKILFIDAGHYETEIFSLGAVENKIKDYFQDADEDIKIYKYSGTTNPIKFFNN